MTHSWSYRLLSFYVESHTHCVCLFGLAGTGGGLEREWTADCFTPGVSEFLCREFKVLLSNRELMLSEAD